MSQSHQPPAYAPTFDRDALHERAERDALRERRDGGTARERPVPQELAALVFQRELERDAAKDEPEQQRDHRRIQRRHHDRVGERKDREEPAAAQHEPGLVAVPHRRDGVHHLVAVGFFGQQRERMPTPRSKPSRITYAITASAITPAQTSARSTFYWPSPGPWPTSPAGGRGEASTGPGMMPCARIGSFGGNSGPRACVRASGAACRRRRRRRRRNRPRRTPPATPPRLRSPPARPNPPSAVRRRSCTAGVRPRSIQPAITATSPDGPSAATARRNTAARTSCAASAATGSRARSGTSPHRRPSRENSRTRRSRWDVPRRPLLEAATVPSHSCVRIRLPSFGSSTAYRVRSCSMSGQPKSTRAHPHACRSGPPSRRPSPAGARTC